MHKIIKIPFLILYSVLMLLSVKSFAGIEPYTNAVKGPFTNGKSLILKDGKFLDPGSNWSGIVNHSVKNAVSLRVLDSVLIKTPFTYSVTVNIKTYTDPDSVAHAPNSISKTLSVSYDPAAGTRYKGLDSYTFTGAYKIVVTVTGTDNNHGGVPITDSLVELSSNIVVDRSYAFQPAARINPSYSTDTTKITASWNPPGQGAEEYDLEWTTINSGSPYFAAVKTQHGPPLTMVDSASYNAILEKIFRNNSTRITTNENSYAIPILTTDTYILIRIRQVQYLNGIRQTGDWDYRTGTNYAIFDVKWHQPGLNWQYSAAFAEDGKKKEVISYFDGTLRGRQTVTINNSDEVEVVQENVYDEFGRPAASILPAPNYESSGVPYLHYIPKFNQNAAGKTYNFANATATIGNNCEFLPDALANTSGASKYYSNQSDFNTSGNNAYRTYNKFTPTAGGYPLSVTQYTADNTGRIKIQGGVGPDFQPGMGASGQFSNTTKYFYGKPDQWELDQLFGNDVGYAEHYTKNMVVDPNGQASISYLNASGKTIATALAGKSPANVDSLDAPNSQKFQKINILQPSQFAYDASALKLTATTTYLAAATGNVPLSVSIKKLVDNYPGGAFQICSNCYYNMTISITDDCGETVYDKSHLITIGSATSNPADTGLYQVPITSTPTFNHIGEYYITIELAFDNSVINNYTDNFVTQSKNNGYLEQQFGYIKKRFLDTLNIAGAYSDCKTCSTLLGQKSDFTQAMRNKFLALEVDTTSMGAAFNRWSDSLYTDLKNKCTALQATCNYSPCSPIRDIMLQDVSPGGQYALFDANYNLLETSINVLVNFRTVYPILSPDSSRYKSGLITRDDGSITSLYDPGFTLKDLIKYWKPEWASDFLTYHPEYCKLKFCNDNLVSENWDGQVQQTDLANDIPTIPGAASRGLSYSYNNPQDWLLYVDPFFASGGTGQAYYSQMSDDLNNYSRNFLHAPDTVSVKGLEKYIDYIMYCADAAATTNATININTWENCSPVVNCRVPDREWRNYRDKYFELKAKYYDLVRNATCSATCSIGTVETGGGLPPPDTDTAYYYRYVIKDQQIAVSTGCGEPDGKPSTRMITITVVDRYGNPTSIAANRPTGYVDIHFEAPTDGTDDTDIRLNVRNVTTYQYNSWTTAYSYNSSVHCSPAKPRYLKCITGSSSGLYLANFPSIGNFTTTCSTDVPKDTGGPPPPVSNCDTSWRHKQTRFPVYQNVVTGGIGQSAGLVATAQKNAVVDSLRTELASITDITATSSADNWILALDSGLNKLGIATGNSLRNSLKSALLNVSKAGSDSTHLFGASDLAGAPRVHQVTDSNFGNAIKRVLGITTFTPSLNPWLIESPYPYKTQLQPAPSTISNTDADICTLLGQYTTEASAAGMTLYNYLVSRFKENMTLTPSELTYLQKSCSTCKFILSYDVTLPVFLDKKSKGYITASDYLHALDTLRDKFTSPLDTTTIFYQPILTNFMNQRFGFALTYLDYNHYKDIIAVDNTALLCNRYAFTNATPDPYAAAENAMAQAVNSGIEEYSNYINTARANFRNSYISVCKLASPSATITAKQQYYHYTLYYYDQADNLVRTVPPEGIALIDSSYFKYIDTARNYDLKTIDCQTPYGAKSSLITLNDKTGAFNQVSSVLTANTSHAMEFWLYTPVTGQVNQVIQETPDTSYLFQVAINAGKLTVDVYSTGIHTSNSLSFTLSNQFAANVPTALGNWSHVVVQGSNFRSGAMDVYLNGQKLSALTGTQPVAAGWTIAPTSTSITFPNEIGTLKHLRIYNRLLPLAEIQKNAADICLMPSNTTSMAGWYRFNVPPAGSATTVADNTSIETTISKIYPDHVLRTNYTYNATNQVVKQNSPDGGTNQYWYDILSRLTISQNDKQLPLKNYSYTLYDDIGRITEVGQKAQTTVTLPAAGYLTDATISSFKSAGTNSQITSTYYDGNLASLSGLQTTLPQNNQRKRVSATAYRENAADVVQQATYYDYDLDGNVKTLWQQVDSLGTKRIDYEYDLISGKVNFVRYQDGQKDRFYYKYNYDAENRLTEAWSGTEAMVNPYTGSNLLVYNGRMDARYYYYLHGPLARLELGDVTGKVQGIDYAYTLQGWLKGVNSTLVTSAQDMGADGKTGSTIPADAYGYSLYYHGDGNTKFDYQSQAGGGQPFEAAPYQLSQYRGLYNGNIAAGSMNIPKLGTDWQYTAYRYDQLNRLTSTNNYKASNSSADDHYRETFAYDGNGNITSLYRTADSAGVAMDNLTYRYTTDANGRITNNKLNYINDTGNATLWTNDLKNQASNNYKYDAIGNLIADINGGIIAVGWNVYGKIQGISKSTVRINYYYNSAQQRTKKRTGGVNTWYVRDAQGNTLAVYDNQGGNTNWREQQLYGSSRLGTFNANVRLGTDSSYTSWDTLGHKQYELTNHLGNVMATITDRRVQVPDSGITTVDHYAADISNAQLYYAFGSLQPNRSFTLNSNYRYGFNGKENDNDVKGTGNEQDYGMRIYDPRVGRFLSVDPLTRQFPFLTPYSFAENDVISSIDLDGREKYRVTVRAYIPWDRVVLGPVNFMTLLAADKEYSVHGEKRSAAFDLSKLGYNENISGKEGYRVQYQFDVDLSASSGNEVSAPRISAGTTKVYEREDKRTLFELIMGKSKPNWRETFSGKAATGGDNQLGVNTVNNQNKAMAKDFTTELKINARFPYHEFPFTFFPAIDAKLYLNFTKDKNGSAFFSGTAFIDGFPAYEGFIQRVDKPGTPMKFLDWKPTAGWKGIDLFPVLGDRAGMLPNLKLETDVKAK